MRALIFFFISVVTAVGMSLISVLTRNRKVILLLLSAASASAQTTGFQQKTPVDGTEKIALFSEPGGNRYILVSDIGGLSGGSDGNGIFSIVNEGDTVAVRNINLDSVFTILAGTHRLQVIGTIAAGNTGTIVGINSDAGHGVFGQAVSGRGVSGLATTGNGVYGQSSTGTAGRFVATSTGGLGFSTSTSSTGTSDFLRVAEFQRSGSAAQPGLGVLHYFRMPDSAAVGREVGYYGYRWNDPGVNLQARFDIHVASGGATNRKMSIGHDGQLVLDEYTGSKTGTIATTAAFTSSGALIQTVPSHGEILNTGISHVDTFDISGSNLHTVRFGGVGNTFAVTVTDTTITVTNAGIYEIKFHASWTWHSNGSGADENVTYALYRNDTLVGAGEFVSSMFGGVDRYHTGSFNKTMSLSASDVLKIKVSGGGTTNEVIPYKRAFSVIRIL